MDNQEQESVVQLCKQLANCLFPNENTKVQVRNKEVIVFDSWGYSAIIVLSIYNKWIIVVDTESMLLESEPKDTLEEVVQDALKKTQQQIEQLQDTAAVLQRFLDTRGGRNNE